MVLCHVLCSVWSRASPEALVAFVGRFRRLFRMSVISVNRELYYSALSPFGRLYLCGMPYVVVLVHSVVALVIILLPDGGARAHRSSESPRPQVHSRSSTCGSLVPIRFPFAHSCTSLSLPLPESFPGFCLSLLSSCRSPSPPLLCPPSARALSLTFSP